MAVNLLNKKLNWTSRTQAVVNQLLASLDEALDLRQEAIDNGFHSGGANPITNDELNTGSPAPFPHLAAADIADALGAVLAIDTTLAASTRAHYKALQKLRS